ncbi:carbonic anhydrase 7-like [Penaeus chinensis]|uniref:carbonic anhydrase 7-like n=1 Tax=Penaeus chinensis TaxID=139456 RepID=UPI001FB7D890|nr:carbonic anhydrase 7-like [Penaeus chinensis]
MLRDAAFRTGTIYLAQRHHTITQRVPSHNTMEKDKLASPPGSVALRFAFASALEESEFPRTRTELPVSGVINNTGHSVVFTLGVTGHHHPSINVTGGPLSYRYQVSHVQVHFGAGDHIGSEHTVNGTAFPAELQVYGFNSQLFSNFSEAVNRAHGVVAISVLLQLGTQGHPGLRPLTDAVQRVRWAGTSSLVERVSVRALLPDSHHYITYDGSLTQPPCHETVTWVLVNRPVYITKQQLHGLRQIHQGSKDVPKGKMLNNYRPTQQLYHRPLRTNIDFTNSRQLHCPSMAPQMYYTGESALAAIAWPTRGGNDTPFVVSGRLLWLNCQGAISKQQRAEVADTSAVIRNKEWFLILRPSGANRSS